jgi:hypothetical protein
MTRKLMICVATIVTLAARAPAQSGFSSGSTGADGAFAPTQSATVQVPASGTFNYTTVSVPAGVTITYAPNASNTPVTILATGDVDISGSIVVDGQPGNNAGFGGAGGPGGFSGGSAQPVQATNGYPGNGPGGGGGGLFVNADFTYGNCSGGTGGGYATAGNPEAAQGSVPAISGGASYGSPLLMQLVGGSGGGGGTTMLASNYFSTMAVGGGGGGGGGAILIASSTQIVFPTSGNGTGLISANGGAGALGITNPSASGDFTCDGGGGAGGGIHLVSNTVSGTAQFNISGGSGGACGAVRCGTRGGFGYVRVDAYNLSAFNPTSSDLVVSAGQPYLPAPAMLPSLQIASVAGVSTPSTPSGSFQNAPDVVLPPNQSNPVTVVINGANVPSGTTVTLTALASTGSSTTASSTLSGTTASSTASVSISLPGALSVLTASTTALVADSKPFFMNGEHVDKIEVAARFGGAPEVTYITHSGKRIRASQ